MDSQLDATRHAGYGAPPPDGVQGHLVQPLLARRQLTPPRLLPAVPPRPGALVPARLTTANLQLPVEVVRRRAAEYASFARLQGTRHSMRLWRTCYQQAVQALAREAAHVADGAPCEALFWEQKGGEYWISATFGPPVAAPLH